MKTCTKCGVAKLLSDFHVDSRTRRHQCRSQRQRSPRNGQGVESICKTCRAEMRRPGIVEKRRSERELRQQGLKKCSACGDVKPFAAFHERRASKGDGRSYKCIPCTLAYLADFRKRRPNQFREWYETNKSARAEYWRTWYETHKEKRSAQYAMWAQRNPHIVNALVAKRTAIKKHAMPPWANPNAIRAMYEAAARLTRETGIRYEVDHIYPLQSADVCGLHWEGNLQIITKPENIRKGNKMPGRVA